MHAARRNDSIDLLRAIAILLVISAHVSQIFKPVLDVSAEIPRAYGANGVQLFFIISGYTMMLAYGSTADLASAKSFYIRRIFRITPMFWLAAAVYFLQYGFGPRYWAPQGITLVDIGLTFSFLNGLRPNAMNSVVPGGWSIAAEMSFYLMFPIFFWMFSIKRLRWAPYAIMAAIYCVGIIIKSYFLDGLLRSNWPADQSYMIDAYFYFWLPAQMACFGFGFVLFEAIEKRSIPRSGLFLLFLPAFCMFRLTVFWLFLLSYFIISLKMSSSFFSVIGRASYSMYISHFGVLSVVAHVSTKAGVSIPFEIAFFIVGGLSFAIAHFITKPLIEDRFIAVGRSLSRRAVVSAPPSLVVSH